MENAKSVRILNNLIGVSESGQKGFNEAAEMATDVNLKAAFLAAANDCAQAVAELQHLATTLGGKAGDSGSAAGTARRGWIQHKHATDDQNITVLEGVERGQDHAMAAYAKALRETISPAVRRVIEKQAAGAQSNQARFREIRSHYQAAA